MTTITTRQAVHEFGKYARLAKAGKKILVTHAGTPLVLLQAPPKARRQKAPKAWPDFPAHWRRHFDDLRSGPTATELLAQDKEDRF
jgi:antitoxin (DNA-binding transcriptional repressor) of toxin-antitoxin stability system